MDGSTLTVLFDSIEEFTLIVIGLIYLTSLETLIVIYNLSLWASEDASVEFKFWDLTWESTSANTFFICFVSRVAIVDKMFLRGVWSAVSWWAISSK